MVTKDFTNIDIPALDENCTVEDAQRMMKKYHLTSIAATINGNLGIFDSESFKSLPKETPLENLAQVHIKVSVAEHAHIWETINTFNIYETNLLPIVNNENEYIGVAGLRTIFKRVFEIFPIGNGGAILELEVSYRGYSLSELSSIVENAEAKITLLSVVPMTTSNNVMVVFSIDKDDATEVISALERHGYQVNSWFMNKGKIDSILEERYSAFMKYINV